MQQTGRIFSGMRPTGRLHIGNYLGALKNWVDLQDSYQCIYCAVDIHALTTISSADETNDIAGNIEEMVLDWLAAGLDPERSILFVQSHVPEVMSLHTLLSMVTPLGWLMRVPTFKEKVRQMGETDETVNYGLGRATPSSRRPTSSCTKLMLCRWAKTRCPTWSWRREIVRRFNHMFGETFPEPQAKLTEVPLIVGLDGQQKMSKTLDNHIDIALTPEDTQKRVLTAFTDPKRTHRNIPGTPEVCNVYSLHKTFTPSADLGQHDLPGVHRRCAGLRGLQA